MTCVVQSLKRKIAMLSILLLTNILATLMHSEFWSNSLSPVNAYCVASILLFTYIKSDNKSKNIAFLFYSLACFSWAIADTLWAVYFFVNKDPEISVTIMIFYAIPNLLMLLAFYFFALQQFRKWNYIQLCIDIILVASMSFLLVWITFVHKDISLLKTMLESDFTSIFSIVSDIFIGIGIISWFLSIRSGSIPISIKIMAFGTMLYVVVDMLYYYTYFNNQYISNSLIDFSYILTLQILAFGALWKTYASSDAFNLLAVTNKGNKSKWLFLLIFPLVAIFFKVTNMFSTQLNIWDIALFVFLIFVYKAFCNYVQISIENERLLEHEKNMNVILEQRVEAQISKLSFLENQDTLTSLFNRNYFISCLDKSIETRLDSDLLAVLLIDVDRFKAINDCFGPDVGDKVLTELSYKIVKWNRYGATIARLGGDEFALIIIGKYTRKDIEGFCCEIIDLFSQPLNVGFDSLQITISLGAALYSLDAKNSTEILKNANIAMYQAKSQGYNKHQFFDPFFNKQINKNIEIERLLRKSNIEKDFDLFYQPQFSLPDKKLIGAEALLRWRTVEYGYIPPSEFIPIAEEFDYILEIGKWVMKESIQQGAKWNNEHSLQLEIGFNVSVKQLWDESFAEVLELMASDKNFHAEWIDAEITESIMITDKSKVKSIFNLFNRLGISVSIDDFGSGYSSLGYMNELSFNRIKIDKSLIDKVTSNNLSAIRVINAIISMAKAIGVKTIAEGVETQEQLDILTELGCDQVQGYFLGRPVPPSVFETNFINNHLQQPLKVKNICQINYG